MFLIRNPSFFFPFYFFIPTFVLIISKYLFESTAKTIYLGDSSNVLIMIFLQIAQNCLVATVHYWIRRLHLKLGWPTIFINVLFAGIYLEIFGFTLYDFENTRHNMQIVLPSTYVAYLGRFGMEQKVFHEFWSNIKGTTAHSNSVSNIIKTTILDSPQFWIQLLVSSLLFALSGIVLIFFNWKRIIDSVFTRSYLEKTGRYIPQYSNNQNLLFFNQRNLKNPEYFSVLFILIHFLALIDVLIETIVLFTAEDFKARYFSFLPYTSSLILALTHFESRPSKQTLANVANITRNFLPPGRLWLDTRDDPIYPEVHADIEAFCAYNPTSSKCEKKGASLTSMEGDESDKEFKDKDKKSDEKKTENDAINDKTDNVKESLNKEDRTNKDDEKESSNKYKEDTSNKDKENSDKDKESATDKEKENSAEKDKSDNKDKEKEGSDKDKESATDKEKDKSDNKEKESSDKDKEETSNKEKENSDKDKESTTDKEKESSAEKDKSDNKEKESSDKDKESTTDKEKESSDNEAKNTNGSSDSSSKEKEEPDYIRRIKERRRLRLLRKQQKLSMQNKTKSRNSDSTNEFLTPEELPNVLLLLYESFNPATYLISKEFIDEHVKNPNSLLTETAFYNGEIMPFLNKFAKEEMVVFSGMQSLGLPSFSGLHSILTQEPPSQTYMNIINGWENEVDDIPSYFHSKGYRTLIVNANRFDFDGKQYWIYKKSRREEALYKMNCLSSYGDSFNNSLQRQIGDYSFVPKMRKVCTEEDVDNFLKEHKDVLDFPRFFDYAAAYYPTQKQAESIGIDPKTIYDHPSISVIGDRIVAKELEAHWKQQRDILKAKGQNKPIFTLASTVDGHMPYTGYDKPEFYPKIDPKVKPHSEAMRVANFLKVNTYTDEYFIKEVINWLKENDPNTILLFTGDHGTRDIPAKEKNGKVTEKVKYDEKCVHESTGSDSFFYVTGGFAYLGDDERVKKALGLDKLAGKTVKFTVDHGDMIYTAEEVLQRLLGKSLKPTNRKSRNLVDMSLDLLKSNDDTTFSEKIDKSGWKSVSMVSHMIEYHNGMRMVRFHPGDIEGAHVYENCVYPTGLLPVDFDEEKDKRNFYVIREQKDEKVKEKGLQFVNEALAYLSAENYLAVKNRLFNYRFRNEACIDAKSCSLPDKLPDLHFKDISFIKFVVGIYFYGCCLIVSPFLLFALLRHFCSKINSNDGKKDFDSLLNDQPVTSL